MNLVYVALGLALLSLVLLIWHAFTPTPPAHTRRLASMLSDEDL